MYEPSSLSLSLPLSLSVYLMVYLSQAGVLRVGWDSERGPDWGVSERLE